MPSLKSKTLLPALQKVTEHLTTEFDQISSERKGTLEQLAQFIRHRLASGKEVWLNFICTHNSRRSHISQLWAQAAAHYYGIDKVTCLSGGTEATAFNPRTVKAMQDTGFVINKSQEGNNPVYEVRYAENAEPIMAFSKTYDDPFNHNNDFAAIMTCSQADANCPMVLGAAKRISITYDDPNAFDDTPQETAKYAERVQQIGREILFAFSQVKG